MAECVKLRCKVWRKNGSLPVSHPPRKVKNKAVQNKAVILHVINVVKFCSPVHADPF